MKDILISKDEVVEKLVNTMIKTIHEIQGVNGDCEDTPVYRCPECGSIFEVYNGWRYCPICRTPIEKEIFD